MFGGVGLGFRLSGFSVQALGLGLGFRLSGFSVQVFFGLGLGFGV